MRIYNITTIVKEHSKTKEQVKKDTVILANNDDLKEFVQMMYGCWFDVISLEYEEANMVHISKNYIKQEALKVMEVRFN
jgi:hypothetical protein